MNSVSKHNWPYVLAAGELPRIDAPTAPTVRWIRQRQDTEKHDVAKFHGEKLHKNMPHEDEMFRVGVRSSGRSSVCGSRCQNYTYCSIEGVRQQVSPCRHNRTHADPSLEEWDTRWHNSAYWSRHLLWVGPNDLQSWAFASKMNLTGSFFMSPSTQLSTETHVCGHTTHGSKHWWSNLVSRRLGTPSWLMGETSTIFRSNRIVHPCRHGAALVGAPDASPKVLYQDVLHTSTDFNLVLKGQTHTETQPIPSAIVSRGCTCAPERVPASSCCIRRAPSGQIRNTLSRRLASGKWQRQASTQWGDRREADKKKELWEGSASPWGNTPLCAWVQWSADPTLWKWMCKTENKQTVDRT